MRPWALFGWLCVVAALGGCATGVSIGATLPLGPMGGVGLVLGPDGRLHTRIGVAVGAGSVSVGTAVDWPASTPQEGSVSPEK